MEHEPKNIHSTTGLKAPKSNFVLDHSIVIHKGTSFLEYFQFEACRNIIDAVNDIKQSRPEGSWKGALRNIGQTLQNSNNDVLDMILEPDEENMQTLNNTLAAISSPLLKVMSANSDPLIS